MSKEEATRLLADLLFCYYDTDTFKVCLSVFLLFWLSIAAGRGAAQCGIGRGRGRGRGRSRGRGGADFRFRAFDVLWYCLCILSLTLTATLQDVMQLNAGAADFDFELFINRLFIREAPVLPQQE